MRLHKAVRQFRLLLTCYCSFVQEPWWTVLLTAGAAKYPGLYSRYTERLGRSANSEFLASLIRNAGLAQSSTAIASYQLYTEPQSSSFLFYKGSENSCNCWTRCFFEILYWNEQEAWTPRRFATCCNPLFNAVPNILYSPPSAIPHPQLWTLLGWWELGGAGRIRCGPTNLPPCSIHFQRLWLLCRIICLWNFLP